MRYVLCSLYLTNVHTHNGRWGVGGGGGASKATFHTKHFLVPFCGQWIHSLSTTSYGWYLYAEIWVLRLWMCFWTVVSKCPYILCWSGECGIWLEAPSVLQHSFSTQLGTDSLTCVITICIAVVNHVNGLYVYQTEMTYVCLCIHMSVWCGVIQGVMMHHIFCH